MFGHEVLHCVYDHLGRREDRDPIIWNVANDYVVNGTLVNEKIGDLITTVPCLYDPQYDGMVSEEIYNALMANIKELNVSDLGTLDEHLDLNEEKGKKASPSSNNGEDDVGVNGPPKYSKEEMKKIKDELKNAMIQAAQSAGAGNVPAGIERMIKDLTEPKMSWREMLDMQIQSVFKNDYSWLRPSRKGWDLDAIMPSMTYDDKVEVSIGMDASGSMTDPMLRDILSEVKGIMEQFADYSIDLWTFDTKVYNHVKITPETVDLFDTYEVEGGGGTDFDVNWQYMVENEITPAKFIMFTDGYPWKSWGDEDYCDTLFVIHGDLNRKIEAPFGLTVYYEEASS